MPNCPYHFHAGPACKLSSTSPPPSCSPSPSSNPTRDSKTVRGISELGSILLRAEANFCQFFFNAVDAINDLYAALGLPDLDGWTALGGDPLQRSMARGAVRWPESDRNVMQQLFPLKMLFSERTSCICALVKLFMS